MVETNEEFRTHRSGVDKPVDRPRSKPLFVIVDDEANFRASFERDVSDLVRCHHAATLSEARTLILELPRIAGAAVDQGLTNGEDGLDLIPEIQDLHPRAAIAVVSGVFESARINKVLHDYRVGFIAKPCTRDQLREHAKRAAMGAPASLDLAAVSRLLDYATRHGFTAAERAFLSAAAQFGSHHDLLARELRLEPSTISQVSRLILGKTGKHRLTEVVEEALRPKP